MHKLKIGSTVWLIIATMVFLVVAISICVLYLDRVNQEKELKAELDDLQQQLSVFQPEKMATQIEQLESQLAGTEADIRVV